MRTVTLMLIPLGSTHGVLLEISDTASSELFRKWLPTPHQAVAEAQQFMELIGSPATVIEDTLNTGRLVVIEGTLRSEADVLGKFPNFLPLS